MVPQVAVGGAHIVIGGSQIRMLRREDLFPDCKGFPLVFQGLLMVPQVAVGGAHIVIGYGQILGIHREVFLTLGHHPQITFQGPPGLAQLSPEPSGKIGPIPLPVLQPEGGQGEARGVLLKLEAVVSFIDSGPIPQPDQEVSAVFVRRLQLTEADLPDHGVDMEQLVRGLEPAAVRQIVQGVSQILLHRTAEEVIIHADLRQKGGAAHDSALLFAHIGQIKQNLQMLIDPLLARFPVVVAGHPGVVPLPEIGTKIGHRHPAPASNNGLRHQVHGHGMTLHSPDQGQQVRLRGILHAIAAHQGHQMRIGNGTDLPAGHALRHGPGSEDQPYATLGQVPVGIFCQQVSERPPGPVEIVDEQHGPGILRPQDAQPLAVLRLPALLQRAVIAVAGEIGLQNRLPQSLPVLRQQVGTAQEVHAAGVTLRQPPPQLDGHLGLAHSAQAPDEYRFPGLHQLLQLLQLPITAALHKGPRQCRQAWKNVGGLHGPGPGQPVGLVVQIPIDFVYPLIVQIIDLPLKRSKVPNILLGTEGKSPALISGFDPAPQVDLRHQHHNDQTVKAAVQTSLQESIQCVLDLGPVGADRHLNCDFFLGITQVNIRKIRPGPVHIHKFSIQHNAQHMTHHALKFFGPVSLTICRRSLRIRGKSRQHRRYFSKHISRIRHAITLFRCIAPLYPIKTGKSTKKPSGPKPGGSWMYIIQRKVKK